LLRAATGPRQEWVRLHESALREVLEPFGITVIQLDPVLVGPDVTQTPYAGTGWAGQSPLSGSVA
jgi:hypothetical protein